MAGCLSRVSSVFAKFGLVVVRMRLIFEVQVFLRSCFLTAVSKLASRCTRSKEGTAPL